MTTPSCAIQTLEPWKYTKQVVVLTVCLLLSVYGIMLYGTYRCRMPEFEDPLQYSIVGEQPQLKQFLDGWGLLHFWFFAMLAFLFPTCWKELCIAGIIWEMIEMMFKEHPFYLADCDAKVKEHSDGWWYGRWEDIVMNSLGILLGLQLVHMRAPFSLFPAGFAVIISGHFALKHAYRKT